MTLEQLLPPIAYLIAISSGFVSVWRGSGPKPSEWMVPAAAGALFWAYSAVCLVQEGVLQFWVNHTTNMTGNQVWFDLLITTIIAFVALLPRARQVGMRLWPWGVATVMVAGLALLPMLARLLYLEGQRTAAEGRIAA